MIIPEPPLETRGCFEPDKLRANVFKNAKDSFEKKLNTIESNNFKLKVSDLRYPENVNFTLPEQKQAILERRDLSVPLKGKVELIDKKTNNVVESKEVILARIPWLTQRNTTINKGVESTTIIQSRLRPGVYSRKTKAGLLEGQINVESGTGVGGKIIFEPTKQSFYYQIQNAKFHLYSLLHDFGIEDKQLEKDWGSDVLNKNKMNYDDKTIDKLYDKIFAK